MEPEPDIIPTRTITVAGALDRLQAEALALELRRLAWSHGIELGRVKIETVVDE